MFSGHFSLYHAFCSKVNDEMRAMRMQLDDIKALVMRSCPGFPDHENGQQNKVFQMPSIDRSMETLDNKSLAGSVH